MHFLKIKKSEINCTLLIFIALEGFNEFDNFSFSILDPAVFIKYQPRRFMFSEKVHCVRFIAFRLQPLIQAGK